MKRLTPIAAKLIDVLEVSPANISNQKLAQALSCTVRSVQKGLSVLNELGIIQVDHFRPTGPGDAARRIVVIDEEVTR